MNNEAFANVLKSFSDDPGSVIIDRNQFVVTIRDDTFTGTLHERMGELQVVENGVSLPAEKWLLTRVAKVTSLAERIISVLGEGPELSCFVDPGGSVNDVLDFNPGDEDKQEPLLLQPIHNLLDRKESGCTTVLYLVSDAGEGKSTIIKKLALEQARRFKSGDEDWLILPVALGGRTMLRLDDVVAGAISNTYRFPFLFYQSLLELVRMNVVVLALDGFEEMFVENSPGDAASSLGALLDGMKSSGSILIASRKAYFDFKGIKSKSRLYDTVFNNTVQFGKISINKWSKDKFIEYAKRRGIEEPDRIFSAIAKNLGDQDNHPLLTRPVLVEKLMDIAKNAQEFNEFLERVRGSQHEFVFEFMRAIIQRENNSKWTDRDNYLRPITSVDEHFEMLEAIALEMWLSGSQLIKRDLLDMAVEMALQTKGKEPRIIRSAVERIKQHALIKTANGNPNIYQFDHEDFYSIFLGRGIARILCGNEPGQTAAILSSSNISESVAAYIAGEVYRLEKIDAACKSIHMVCKSTLPTSFARENGGTVIQHLMAYEQCPDTIDGMNFARLSFSGISRNFKFKKCRITQLDIDSTRSSAVEFDECSIEAIFLGPGAGIAGWKFLKCDIYKIIDDDLELFDPQAISAHLVHRNALIENDSKFTSGVAGSVVQSEGDGKLKTLSRSMRIFFRASEVNEKVFRQRLGANSTEFFDDIIPDLRRIDVLKEVTYTGNGNQLRYKIIKTPSKVLDAIQAASDYNNAIERLTSI